MGFLEVDIKKNRPEWQQGLYNGVGGKVLENESPESAMVREAKEETNLDIIKWTKIDTLEYPDNEVILHLFEATVSKKFLSSYKTNTDELVRLFKLDKLPKNNVSDVPYICKNRLSYER